MIIGLPSLENIIDDKLVSYTCRNNLEDIVNGIKYLKSENIDVVIGKIAMFREARASGLEAVMITSGLETVRTAIMEARRVAKVRKQEKRKAEQLKTMLSFSYDGIIVLDKEGKITLLNRVAEELSGWSAEKAINHNVVDVIPAADCQYLLETGTSELGVVFEIGNIKVVGNRVPIIVDGVVEGIVTTFQKIDELQKIESKVRRQLSDKGLKAVSRFSDIIGNSPAIRSTLELAKKYAKTESTILIYGRTGSGKELFAQAIHNESRRRMEPFVAINCAALPESILESELFGYVEGAFTGASRGGKAGVFEMAHGGTLLLDEIGEMPPLLQSRFLRAIEQKEVMRLGDNRILPVNVRIIAATHCDLQAMVKANQFREDLYYRLNVLSLIIPDLKDRDSDIIGIAEHFLKEFYDMQNKPYRKISAQAVQLLLKFNWPGNIRQLRNVMERLAVMTISDSIIGVAEVDKALQIPDLSRPEDFSQKEGICENFLEKERLVHEKHAIIEILEKCDGNKTLAAHKLGISRTTLWRKLQ